MAVALTMAAAAFVLTLVLGYPYVAFLRRAGLGKQVRSEGPSSHLWKTGTPTLGGLLFVASILARTRAASITCRVVLTVDAAWRGEPDVDQVARAVQMGRRPGQPQPYRTGSLSALPRSRA